MHHHYTRQLHQHDAMDKILVAENRPFHPTRRARREQDGGGIIRLRWRNGIKRRGRLGRKFMRLYNPSCKATLAQTPGTVGIRENDCRTDIAEHVRQFGGRTPAVDGNGDTSAREDGKKADHPGRTVLHAQPDPIALSYP